MVRNRRNPVTPMRRGDGPLSTQSRLPGAGGPAAAPEIMRAAAGDVIGDVKGMLFPPTKDARERGSFPSARLLQCRTASLTFVVDGDRHCDAVVAV
jgi:hypothetical protein